MGWLCYTLDAVGYAPTAERRYISVDKLSREATAALNAGMSYGKWKAMQAPVVIPADLTSKTACEHCGKLFANRDKRHRKYCDDSCRIAAANRRKYEQKALSRRKCVSYELEK